MIEVLRPGPYATVQDLGRPGYAHLGVARSGAADPRALGLANRLVGNPGGFAAVELTLGGATLRFTEPAWVAAAGAAAPLRLGTRPVAMCAPVWVPAGSQLEVGVPGRGLRTYVAVRGGIDVEPVLGSRSTDSLSGLGPPPLRAGDRLAVGPASGLDPITVDCAPYLALPAEPVLRVVPGPRDDWFADGALAALCGRPYEVTQDINRVGVRLAGEALRRARDGELPSEGVVAGAVQVPPNGQPIVFLADHPTTGGYPVIAVVTARDLATAAQLRPGDHVRFRRA